MRYLTRKSSGTLHVTELKFKFSTVSPRTFPHIGLTGCYSYKDFTELKPGGFYDTINVNHSISLINDKF